MILVSVVCRPAGHKKCHHSVECWTPAGEEVALAKAFSIAAESLLVVSWDFRRGTHIPLTHTHSHITVAQPRVQTIYRPLVRHMCGVCSTACEYIDVKLSIGFPCGTCIERVGVMRFLIPVFHIIPHLAAK